MRPRLLWRRLVALFRSRRFDRELEGEIQAHLELAERDARAAGLSQEDARRAARQAFGNVDRIREEHRDRRSVRWLETFGKDLRYGVLLLRRDPAFAFVAVGVMALGIGANAAMFSLVDATFLKPLPFSHPERIVRVSESPTPTQRNGTTTLNFLDWKRLSTSFEALSAVRGLNASLTGNGEPARVSGTLVSTDYFEVFGIEPVLGRTFRAGEDEPGASNVVILSNELWRSQFGADRAILERTITLDGEAHQVIGVLPPIAVFRGMGAFWKPLTFAPDQRTRNYHWLGAVGRLKAGVTLEQARREMLAVSESLVPLQPAWKQQWRIALDPYDRDIVATSLRQSIVVAFGAVVMVLLIASANIANLLLARGVARRQEMAVRAALGASRGRIAAQVLAESFVLCTIGAACGVGLAYLLIGAATPLLANTLPNTSVVLDLRVLAFTTLAAVCVSIGVGLLPSMQMSGDSRSPAIALATRSSSSREGMRRTIVVAEVAVSLMLICGAALVFRSLFKLQHVDAGVRIDHIFTMSADLPLSRYPDATRAVRFAEQVVEAVEATPGVDRASGATDLPLLGVRQSDGLTVPGSDEAIGVRFKRVDPNYFATFDIPVLAGRGFTSNDRDGAPRVGIVNEALARRVAERLGVADPAQIVGRTVKLTRPMYENRGQTGRVEDTEIIGIIRNERVGALDAPIDDVAYVSVLQSPRRELRVLVRTAGDPAAAVPAIREAIRRIDPALPLGEIRTMTQVKELVLSGRTQPAWIIGAFAGVAALLAALGLYGVLAHAVNQRRREIGIRMALGARAGDVLSYVVGNALWMVLIGLALGVAGAMALTRSLRTMLFEISTFDPASFGLAIVAMLVIALIATLIPARRATRVDPVSVLRTE